MMHIFECDDANLQTNGSNNDHKGKRHQLAIIVKQLIY